MAISVLTFSLPQWSLETEQWSHCAGAGPLEIEQWSHCSSAGPLFIYATVLLVAAILRTFSIPSE